MRKLRPSIAPFGIETNQTTCNDSKSFALQSHLLVLKPAQMYGALLDDFPSIAPFGIETFIRNRDLVTHHYPSIAPFGIETPRALVL